MLAGTLAERGPSWQTGDTAKRFEPISARAPREGSRSNARATLLPAVDIHDVIGRASGVGETRQTRGGSRVPPVS